MVDSAGLHIAIAQISNAVGRSTSEDELLAVKDENLRRGVGARARHT
jgi:hypothetical protein